MLEQFNGFKKKIKIESLIKCLLPAISTALVIFGVLLILYKTKVIGLNPLFSALISLGSGGVVFLALFFITKPSDNKIAKRLDKTYGLNEKTQTMVVYKDSQEEMIVLQREDTEKRLEAIGAKNFKLKIHFVFYIFAALALATTITSIAIPMQKDDVVDSGDDKPYSLTEWQIEQIKQLITYTSDSKMDNKMKGAYIVHLNTLIEILKTTNTESQKNTRVLATIHNINSEMNLENTNDLLYQTLNGIESEKLNLLAEAIGDYSTKDISSVLYNLQAQYNELSTKDLNAFKDLIRTDSALLVAKLEQTQMDKEDPLYVAIYDFAVTANDLISKVDQNKLSSSKLYPQIIEAINVMEPKVISIITLDKENRDVAWYIEDKLRSLFGLPAADDRGDASGGGSSSDSESDGQQNQGEGGGIGKGDYIFGGEDLMYDFDTNTLVPYGTLYDSYYAIINAMINDGTLSEDMINYVNEYFASLLNSKN